MKKATLVKEAFKPYEIEIGLITGKPFCYLVNEYDKYLGSFKEFEMNILHPRQHLNEEYLLMRNEVRIELGRIMYWGREVWDIYQKDPMLTSLMEDCEHAEERFNFYKKKFSKKKEFTDNEKSFVWRFID